MVTANVINTTKEYKWRLECGNKHSEWSTHYEGVLTHKFNGQLYAYATQYWDGVLPTEVVFKIVEQ